MIVQTQDAASRAAVLNAWAASAAYPANLPKDIDHWTVRSLENFRYRINQLPVLTEENLTSLAAEMIATKQLDTVEPLVRPEDALPWPDEPRLRNLRTIEDFRKLTTEQIHIFTQPVAVDTGLHAKFNERYAYVVTNKLHAAPKADESQPAEDPILNQCRDFIGNISGKDIGWNNSDSSGKAARVKSIQNQLRSLFIRLCDKKVKPVVILRDLQVELSRLSSSSIR